MSIDAANGMKDRLRADLLAAMKERDMAEVGTLRTLIAALDNAEAPPAAQRVAMPGDDMTTETERLLLDAGTVAAVIAAEIAERERAAAEFDRLGRADRAAQLRAEAAIGRRYLA